MCPIIPRTFVTDGVSQDPGYYNATLGTGGVALLFPAGSRKALVQVGGACRIGVRPTDALAAASNANYGAILNGNPIEIGIGVSYPTDASTYLHIIPEAETAVAVVFV